MRRITDVRELRERQMLILDQIHAFCLQHHLVYSISSGTLLGAIRHGGYIPWDDDLDIYMPRDDYNQFVKLFPVRGQYQLLSHSNAAQYMHNYAKVIDSATFADEKGLDVSNYGIWVDVFPTDHVSNFRPLRWLHNALRKFLLGVIRVRSSVMRPSNLKEFAYYLTPLTCSAAFSLLNCLIQIVKRSDYVFNMSDGGPNDVERKFHASCFSDMVELQFEDRTYLAMGGFDEYLKMTYGNYMQLPPEDQRVHHDFCAFIK